METTLRRVPSRDVSRCTVVAAVALLVIAALALIAADSGSKRRCFMPLVHVLLVLIVVGVLLWLVNTYIPMAGSIKSILNAVVVIVVVLWLLNVFGLMDNLTKLRVGK